jgi:hypothetical protein
MAAQQRRKSNKGSRRNQTQIPLMIFPNAWEAASFLRANPHYDPAHVQYSEDHRPGFFPETTTEFESRDQALEYLEQYPRGEGGGAYNEGGITANNNYQNNWTEGEHASWRLKKKISREAQAQRKWHMDQGWVHRENGTWINERLPPSPRQRVWAAAANNWEPEAGYAEYSGHAEFEANEDDVLEDIDQATLKYLRRDLVAKTGGNTSVYEDGSINPSGALYCIKILLMQHGNRALYDHTTVAYPQTEIERKIALQRSLYAKIVATKREWEASGGSNIPLKHKLGYLRLQHESVKNLVKQLKLTTIASYKLERIDTFIQELAAEIEMTHLCIATAEAELDRYLTFNERVSICLKNTGINITHFADKIVQLAGMIVNHAEGDLHKTKVGQKLIIEEIENALAVLKLYTILDQYGGEGDTREICALVCMDEYDGYLSRLARTNGQYRASLYQGRLFDYSLRSIPGETLKRAAMALKLGVGGAIRETAKIAKTAAREGVRTALSLSAGAVFSRLSGALFGALRELSDSVLTPELAAIDSRVNEWRVPPTIPELRAVVEAVTQTESQNANNGGFHASANNGGPSVLAEVGQTISDILDEADEAGLDELVHDPQLRAFEVRAAGYNHFMYYIHATGEWREMEDGELSFEEIEERITRDAIYASLEPDQWEQHTDYAGGYSAPYWYNPVTGEYADEHPVGAREIYHLQGEVEELAASYDRDTVQQDLASVHEPRTLVGLTLRPMPSAADLREAGSDTCIMDAYDLSGRVNESRKLQREIRDMRSLLLSGPEYERGEESSNNEYSYNNTHAAQWAQIEREQSNSNSNNGSGSNNGSNTSQQEMGAQWAAEIEAGNGNWGQQSWHQQHNYRNNGSNNGSINEL